MKLKIAKTIALSSIALTCTGYSAVILTPNVGTGVYNTTASNALFTDYATNNGGTTTGGFAYTNTGYGHQSGSTTPSTLSTLTIPFQLDGGYVFSTASLALSAVNRTYYSTAFNNTPYVQVDVTVNSVTTTLFSWESPDKLPGQATPFNFNGLAPASGPATEEFATSVNLSSLVAGFSNFSITYIAFSGYSAELGLGGAFYYETQAPFSLTGVATSAIPEPSAAVTILGLASLGVAMNRRRFTK
jgi:hypothetical protein